MIEDTPGMRELLATGNAEVLHAQVKPPPATIGAMRIKKGFLVVRYGASLPVVGGKTSATLFQEGHPSKLAHLLDIPLTPTGSLDGRVFIHGAPSHYHFLMHQFPRFLFLNSFPDRPDVHMSTIHFAAASVAEAARGLLPRLARGRPVQVERLADGVYEAADVIVPIVPTPAAAVFFNRQIVRPALLSANAPPPRRRIFVRRTAASRRLTNAAEIEAWLAARGYEGIDPGTLSFADQVRLFADATHIVGVEGGAMTNIVYAPEGARILILASPALVEERFFSSIAKHSGQQLQTVFGEIAAGDGARSADFTMPLEPIVAWASAA